jgi:hypothetical protein
LEGSGNSGREEGEQDPGQENNSCINVSVDSMNRIDCILFVYIQSNGWFSVKYLTLRWISKVPEYDPIGGTSLRATAEFIEDTKKMDKDAGEV